MTKILINERGLTLVEVLASLVIISIVLMSFMALFTNTNRLAISNNEKLVVINLADAYLERLKANPLAALNPDPENITEPFPPALGSCQTKEGVTYSSSTRCKNVILNSLPPVNGKNYIVQFEFSQDSNEKNLSLMDVVVSVTAADSGMSSSVEGYLNYE